MASAVLGLVLDSSVLVALELGYGIGTHNARDFRRIPGLEVVLL